MPPTTHISVLVIGASRGLGLAIAAEYLERGARVVATARATSGTALHDLAEATAGDLEVEVVDIDEPDQVAALRSRLEGRRFELLLVNAGVTNPPAQTVVDVPTEEFVRLMVTNALSPMRTVEALGDLVDSDGTIAVMSSGQGSVTNNTRGGFEIYRASKAALNQLMRSYDARHRGGRRTLLLLAPGWVKTDLGGPDARLSVEESIPRLVTTVDTRRHHPGLCYLDYTGCVVPW